MEIRKAAEADWEAIRQIYAFAREQMERQGNPTQWPPGYPVVEYALRDMQEGNCFVCVKEGRVAGVFSFILGEDRTYQVLEEGSWHGTGPYGTIHRLASGGLSRGVAQSCFDFCAAHMDYLRMDTHENNRRMQFLAQRFGFQKCGRIYAEDGTPRIAYDYRKDMYPEGSVIP